MTVTLTDAQTATLSAISPTGLLLNEGTPCECPGDDYNTRKERTYSDGMVYHHSCPNCGNEFSTWTEG